MLDRVQNTYWGKDGGFKWWPWDPTKLMFDMPNGSSALNKLKFPCRCDHEKPSTNADVIPTELIHKAGTNFFSPDYPDSTSYALWNVEELVYTDPTVPEFVLTGVCDVMQHTMEKKLKRSFQQFHNAQPMRNDNNNYQEAKKPRHSRS
jgi:hypothetical protein